MFGTRAIGVPTGVALNIGTSIIVGDVFLDTRHSQLATAVDQPREGASRGYLLNSCQVPQLP